jgi:hypothetical protein
VRRYGRIKKLLPQFFYPSVQGKPKTAMPGITVLACPRNAAMRSTLQKLTICITTLRMCNAAQTKSSKKLPFTQTAFKDLF